MSRDTTPDLHNYPSRLDPQSFVNRNLQLQDLDPVLSVFAILFEACTCGIDVSCHQPMLSTKTDADKSAMTPKGGAGWRGVGDRLKKMDLDPFPEKKHVEGLGPLSQQIKSLPMRACLRLQFRLASRNMPSRTYFWPPHNVPEIGRGPMENGTGTHRHLPLPRTGNVRSKFSTFYGGTLCLAARTVVTCQGTGGRTTYHFAALASKYSRITHDTWICS